MCGVCGIVGGSETAAEPIRARVELMTRLLRHRGPDDAGVAASGHGVLGSTRLTIRGNDAGRQPLLDEPSGVLVVCNGEIDNHQELREFLQERGRTVPGPSDVAVLPGLYLERGDDFVEDLRGSFALALWDPRESKLLLARDPAGERPLFYALQDQELAFSTELSALASVRLSHNQLDQEALAGYLRFGCFVAPSSPIASIRKVHPAEVIRFWMSGTETEAGTGTETELARPRWAPEIVRHSYWRWPSGPGARTTPDPGEFDRIFRAAVKRQSDCDVEFGVFLSGGVDSSLIAAVARDLHPERALPAFTLRFDEASYDEGDAAGEVARRLGLENREVWVRAEHFPQRIRELVRLVGEPLGDPAWVPVSLLAQRAAQEVKLVLVGEGGDEVFGGYPTYPGALLAQSYQRLPRFVRGSLAAIVRRWPASDKKVTVSFLLKRFVDGDGLDPLARHYLWTSTLSPELLARLGVHHEPDRPFVGREELLDQLQRHDLETTLAEGLLTKTDRAAMGWALESRAPFLDQAVMEFAATLPARDRVHRLQTKTFLKRYALRYLPRSIVHRRKRGLSVPLSIWLRGSLQSWARERLATGALEMCGVKTPALLALLDEHVSRRADHARALWNLLVLVEWIEWWQTLGERSREVGSRESEAGSPLLIP